MHKKVLLRYTHVLGIEENTKSRKDGGGDFNVSAVVVGVEDDVVCMWEGAHDAHSSMIFVCAKVNFLARAMLLTSLSRDAMHSVWNYCPHTIYMPLSYRPIYERACKIWEYVCSGCGWNGCVYAGRVSYTNTLAHMWCDVVHISLVHKTHHHRQCWCCCCCRRCRHHGRCRHRRTRHTRTHMTNTFSTKVTAETRDPRRQHWITH